MASRVVCGLSATMASFVPARRFSSVDFGVGPAEHRYEAGYVFSFLCLAMLRRSASTSLSTPAARAADGPGYTAIVGGEHFDDQLSRSIVSLT
jgi:hypothetical protein